MSVCIIALLRTMQFCQVQHVYHQEIAGLIPAGSGKILSHRLIIKYFLQSFALFR